MANCLLMLFFSKAFDSVDVKLLGLLMYISISVSHRVAYIQFFIMSDVCLEAESSPRASVEADNLLPRLDECLDECLASVLPRLELIAYATPRSHVEMRKVSTNKKKVIN